MDIAKNLVNLRKEHHLTQEQMAEKLQMSKNGYAKLERGESKLNIKHIYNKLLMCLILTLWIY